MKSPWQDDPFVGQPGSIPKGNRDIVDFVESL